MKTEKYFFTDRYIRVRHCVIQAHVLQCNTKFAKDMGSDCYWNYCDVRVHQVAGIFDHSEQSSIFDDRVVQFVDIFPLLRLVGVHQLLQ